MSWACGQRQSKRVKEVWVLMFLMCSHQAPNVLPPCVGILDWCHQCLFQHVPNSITLYPILFAKSWTFYWPIYGPRGKHFYNYILELHINLFIFHFYYLWKYRSLDSWPKINLSTMYVFGLSRYLLSPTSLINLLDFNTTLWLHRCFKHFETLQPHIHNLSCFPPMNLQKQPRTHTHFISLQVDYKNVIKVELYISIVQNWTPMKSLTLLLIRIAQ
jgi:hypothetical protein